MNKLCDSGLFLGVLCVMLNITSVGLVLCAR